MKITKKSEGIDEGVWMQEVMRHIESHQTLFPVDEKPLKHLYHRNYSIEEAILKCVTKGHMSAYMELHVKHELGEYRTTFRTENQAKDFFLKFPEIRQELTP